MQSDHLVMANGAIFGYINKEQAKKNNRTEQQERSFAEEHEDQRSAVSNDYGISLYNQ